MKGIVAEAFSRAVKFKVMNIGRIVCREYEDRNFYISLLTQREEVPRMCLKYISGDMFNVLHPLLRCASSYLYPLLIYVKVKDPNVKLNEKRIPQKVKKSSNKLSPYIQSLFSADIDWNSNPILVVDGSRSTLLSLIMCPKIYGFYLQGDEFVFIGSRKRIL